MHKFEEVKGGPFNLTPWLVLTWGPICEQTDMQYSRLYLWATSLVGGKDASLRIVFKEHFTQDDHFIDQIKNHQLTKEGNLSFLSLFDA